MKKLWVAVFILFLCLPATTMAKELSETIQELLVPRWTTSMDIGYYSCNFGGTAGQTIYDGEVSQGSVKFMSPWGGYLKFWFSYSLDRDSSADGGKEIDYIVGAARKINKFDIDLSVARYNLVDINDTRGDINACRLELSYSSSLVDPYVNIDGNYGIDKEVLKGGWVWKLGAKKGFEIPFGFGTGLDLYLTGNDGAFVFDPELVSAAGLKGNLGWKANSSLSFTLEMAYQYGIDQGAENSITEDEEVFGGLKVSYSFGF